MEIINKLNKKMADFYKSWEFENTEEQFIALSGELETTQEMKSNIEKFQSMTNEIEEIINDKDNFEEITENWDSINLPTLDILISTFEIEINDFRKMIEINEVRKDIKDFILNR